MAQQEDNHGEMDKDLKVELNYRSPELRGRGVYGVLLGIASFVALLIQFPWVFLSAFMALGGNLGLPSVGRASHAEATFVDLFVSSPSLFAIVAGLWSVKIAGISFRNTFGIIGLLGGIAIVSTWVLGGSVLGWKLSAIGQ